MQVMQPAYAASVYCCWNRPPAEGSRRTRVDLAVVVRGARLIRLAGAPSER